MKYTAAELAHIGGGTVIGNSNRVINQIAFDSRNIYSADHQAFIAINTQKSKGENYIAQALEKGVNVIIAEKQTIDNDEVTWIVVENSLTFLQKVAQFHRNRFPKLKTIGVTGSNGKTIVKEWLYQSLWNEFSTVKSPKSYNSQLGLPLSVLQISEKNTLGIFEAGISKPGEMQILEEILHPEIGILTYIGTAHSANFTDENQLISEKIKLFRHSETVIYHADNPAVKTQIENSLAGKKLISFGFENGNEIQLLKGRGEDSDLVSVSIFGEEISFPVRQRDDATLTNALAVIATLHHLGLSTELIIQKINELKSIEMRLESVQGDRNNIIINDSFNLDPDSLRIALQHIKEYKKDKKVLILSDMLEVDESSEILYPKIAKMINAAKFDLVILIGDYLPQYHTLFDGKTLQYSSVRKLIESQNLQQIQDSLILLKGARKFEFEKIKLKLEFQKHDTVLEINLNAILHNIMVHKSLLKEGTKIMCMVKAFSYGLGGYEIAEFLQHHHLDYLGVAYADEGVELRRNGITMPIIVMNPEQQSYDTVIEHNLEPEIYSLRVLKLFIEKLREKGVTEAYPIHIKLETGMNRLGFGTQEIDQLCKELNNSNLKVASIFSHMSSADVPDYEEYTVQQAKIFEENSQKVINCLGCAPLRHILNSAGISNYPQFQYDMVRIGIGMVGISANRQVEEQLQQAVVFKTVISQISTINPGDSVGYARKYQAEKETKVATIPVGYADGIPRLIGNKNGFVGIRKKLVPIIGNVCMDMMMLELENVDAQEGDEVIIFNGAPTLQQFAGYCQTIPYEVLTSISRRVKRIYVKN